MRHSIGEGPSLIHQVFIIDPTTYDTDPEWKAEPWLRGEADDGNLIAGTGRTPEPVIRRICSDCIYNHGAMPPLEPPSRELGRV